MTGIFGEESVRCELRTKTLKTADYKHLPFYETSTENRYLAHYKMSQGGMAPPRLQDNNKK